MPGAVALVAALGFTLTVKDRVLPRAPGRFELRGLLAAFALNPRTHRDLAWTWLSKALIMFGFSAVSSYLTLFLAAEFGLTDTDDQLRFNLWATIVSVSFKVPFALLGGAWSDRAGRRRPFVAAGGLIVAGGTLLTAVTPLLGQDAGLATILVAEAFLGAGSGLFLAVDAALCIEVLPNAENTAKDLGVLNMANTLPSTVAPFLAGTAFIPLGHALFGNGYSLWFAVAALVAALGSVFVYQVKNVD